MINILIRFHKGREVLFDRCIQSIINQTYKDVRVIVSYDEAELKPFLQGYEVETIRVDKQEEFGETHYNLYCNDLKKEVVDGFFFYLDSDDYIATNDALEKISKEFDGYKAIVCQMERSLGYVKPSDENIKSRQVVSGKIGLPCIFVHHSEKDRYDFDSSSNADFKYIQSMKRAVKTKFVQQVVVKSPKRSFGK